VNALDIIFGTLALLSFALLLWQWIAAVRFPLHRRIAHPGFAPAITLFKPLKGCDDTTAASLESWLKQNYAGPTQVLFGVANPEDPACRVVDALLKKYPHHDAQLIICPETYGANGKVSTLIQLEKLAKHDLVLVSDADVRVPEDFLANVVAPLREQPVGLVNCFYRLANPTTVAMQWEAIGVNADFWSQVLQSQMLKPMDFALGAVMLTRRRLLTGIGGFQSLANCLADDYQLGQRVAKSGHRIVLCPVVVECWDAPTGWRAAWKHQLRWARTIRVCQSVPYFFSILSNATLWPLLWLIASLPQMMVIANTPSTGTSIIGIRLPWELPIAAALLLGRILVAQRLQRRLASERQAAPPWLVPVKDLLQAATWFGAFAGNTIEWRGQQMKLDRDGTLREPK